MVDGVFNVDNSLAVMKTLAKWLGFAVSLALIVHFIFHVSLGWSMLGFLVGWPIVGLIVTADDDLPGGWSNPEGKTPPPWSYREFWGEFVLRGALSGIGFAADAVPEFLDVAIWLAVALGGSVAGIAIIRSCTYEEATIDG